MSLNKLNKRINKTQSLLCIGLDADFDKLPEEFKSKDYPQFEFNKWIIDQTHEYVVAYKPNTAFYEARGAQGWQELALTMDYLEESYPDIFTICDAKRADIGNTNKGYVTAIFDELGFDAITLHPYLGKEALVPFLERDNKVSIILCKTSNPGSGELQDQLIDGKKLWQLVAEKVSTEWNTNSNCMLVVGATYPDELEEIRQIVGDMPLLIPGIGAQGGDLEATLKAGLTKDKSGLLISSSRGVIFSESPGESAKKLNESINQYR